MSYSRDELMEFNGEVVDRIMNVQAELAELEDQMPAPTDRIEALQERLERLQEKYERIQAAFDALDDEDHEGDHD